jgi:hypothetical protein
MKLAQRQQGEGNQSKWGTRMPLPVDEAPVIRAASPPSSADDNPYRGKSDGEILQRCEL